MFPRRCDKKEYLVPPLSPAVLADGYTSGCLDTKRWQESGVGKEMCSVVASVPPPHQATRATSSLLMGCGSLKVVLLCLLFCWGGKWLAVNDLWPCLSIPFSIINPPLPQHSHQRSLSQMFAGPFHLLSPCCSASCHSLPGSSDSQAGFALSFSSSGQACLTSSLILPCALQHPMHLC